MRHRILVKPLIASFCAITALPGSRLVKTVSKGVQVIEVETDDVYECCQSLRCRSDVEYAELDGRVSVSSVPNDTKFQDGTLWGLLNVGQSGGTAGADISAVQAWDLRNSANNVIIGIVDSGIQLTHPDLAANIWTNDLGYGFNAIAETHAPEDTNGHGTHIAGIIGAVGNNSAGVVGVVWHAQLMALRFLGTDGTGAVSDAIQCIDYARENGAKIICCAWGVLTFSQSLKEALVDCQSEGILVVCAAGNANDDNDLTPVYPANYLLDNIISVGATNRNDGKGSISNYGNETVHIGAPGEDIYTTWIGSTYQSRDGSSCAAGYVTGTAALLLAQHFSISYSKLKSFILDGVDVIAGLANYFSTSGRLNAYNSIGIIPIKEVHTDAQWPSDLPLPLVDYQGRSEVATIGSDIAFAKILRRSRFTTTYATVSVEWCLQPDEIDDFRDFYRTILDNGASQFRIDLRYPFNTELTEWKVRFLGGYELQPDDGIWKARASLELIRKVELTAKAALLESGI